MNGGFWIAALLAVAAPNTAQTAQSERQDPDRESDASTRPTPTPKPKAIQSPERKGEGSKRKRSNPPPSTAAKPQARPRDERGRSTPPGRKNDKRDRSTPTPRSEEALMLQNREFLEMLELLIDLPMIAEDNELETESKESREE